MAEYKAGKSSAFTFAGSDPSKVQMSFLEIELLVLADFRGSESYDVAPVDEPSAASRGELSNDTAPPYQQSPAPDGESPNQQTVGRGTQADGAAHGQMAATVFAQDDTAGPCSKGFDNLGWYKDLELVSLDDVSSVPIEKAFDSLDERMNLGLSKWNKFPIFKVASVARLYAQMKAINLSMDHAVSREYSEEWAKSAQVNWNFDGLGGNDTLAQ